MPSARNETDEHHQETRCNQEKPDDVFLTDEESTQRQNLLRSAAARELYLATFMTCGF